MNFAGVGSCPPDPIWTLYSPDQRLKKNIEPLASALDKLLRLRGVTFEWKNPEERGAGSQIGFIAQEVEKVFPTWVDENADGFKGIIVQPLQLAALQVEALRTLKARNDELRDRVKALEVNHRPAISGFGTGLASVVGLAIFGGAFLIFRRKRTGEPS